MGRKRKDAGRENSTLKKDTLKRKQSTQESDSGTVSPELSEHYSVSEREEAEVISQLDRQNCDCDEVS